MKYTASELIKIAENEVGYLEKKSNSDLDSKTANAGYNNYTKYSRDLYAAGYYNGNKQSFAWCDCFTDWLFLQLCKGDAVKAEWLICQTGDCGAGCNYSAQYYRNAGRFYSSPEPGDQIFFGTKGDESHTGIVYKVDSYNVYTIEGNTSGESGVVANGGGVFKKSYARNYYKIVGYGRPRYDTEIGANTGGAVSGNAPASTTMLRQGNTGSAVKNLQQNLIKLGYSCGSSGADGIYGSLTVSAVKRFQASAKIAVDGIYGPNTEAALKDALAAYEDRQSKPSSEYSLNEFIRDVQKAIGAGVDGIAGPETLSKTVTVSAATNNRHAVVRAIQKRLEAIGYEVGTIDGIAGAIFTKAVLEFQNDNGCVSDGVITARNKTWRKLLGMD